MFGLGMPEILVILLVALIVLGPKRLPDVARTLGKGLAEFRKATAGLTDELRGAQDMIEREARDAERSTREHAAAAKAAVRPPNAPAAPVEQAAAPIAPPAEPASTHPEAVPGAVPADKPGNPPTA